MASIGSVCFVAERPAGAAKRNIYNTINAVAQVERFAFCGRGQRDCYVPLSGERLGKLTSAVHPVVSVVMVDLFQLLHVRV
jgi:hypothetical protein